MQPDQWERICESGLEFFWGQCESRLRQGEASDLSQRLLGALDGWRRNLVENPDCSLHLLPYLRRGRMVELFIVGKTSRDFLEARRILNAFCGSLEDTNLFQVIDLDASQTPDSYLTQFGVERAMVATFANIDQYERTIIQLSEMVGVLRHRPKRDGLQFFTLGRLLRDFEAALNSENFSHQNELLDSIHQTGQLSHPNLLFLRLRALGCQRRWQELLDMPNLPEILRLPRPARVNEAICKAIYQVHFRRFDNGTRLLEAVTHCEREVLSYYRPVLLSPASAREAEALKACAIGALSVGDSAKAAYDRAVDLYRSISTDEEFISRLERVALDRFSGESPKRDIGGLGGLIEDGALEDAFALLQELDGSVETFPLALRCASEMHTIESAELAFAMFENLSDEDKSGILQKAYNRNRWQRLNDRFGNKDSDPPSLVEGAGGWKDWVSAINVGRNSNLCGPVLEQGLAEWSLSGFEADPQQALEFAELLTQQSSDLAKARMRNAFQLILGSFARDGSYKRPFKPIYLALNDLVIYEEDISDEERYVLLELATGVWDTGVNRDEAVDLVAGLGMAWGEQPAVDKLGWALDVLEALWIKPNGVEVLDDFARKVLQCVSSQVRGVSEGHWRLLRGMESEFSCLTGVSEFAPKKDESDDSEESASVFAPYSGKKVAIYSLDESSARRAAKILSEAEPDCSVSVNFDHVATDRLRSLAQNSDVFVFVYRKATHSAFDCVQEIRGSNLVQPSGKGSASIIRELERTAGSLLA